MKPKKNKALNLLKYAKDYLSDKNIQDSDLEAKHIVSFVLDINHSDLFLNNSLKYHFIDFIKAKRMLKKRVKGMPLQYILKEQEFYGLKLYVDKRVLIPRSETELLVEKALNHAKEFKSPKILDLCTGSGCIAIAIEKNLSNAEVFASDKSKNALRIAKKNSKKNQAEVTFYKSDLLKDIDKSFDLIVSNPPYINKEDYNMLDKKVLDYEPKLALLGGDDGMDYIEIISKQAKQKLREKGYLLLEIGCDQKAITCECLKKYGYKDIRAFADYSNHDRIVVGRK